MDTPVPEMPSVQKPAADLRDYLAEERTFLAWIRTGLTLMGFGFVVACFGLFLRMMQITKEGAPRNLTGSLPGSALRSSSSASP